MQSKIIPLFQSDRRDIRVPLAGLENPAYHPCEKQNLQNSSKILDYLKKTYAK